VWGVQLGSSFTDAAVAVSYDEVTGNTFIVGSTFSTTTDSTYFSEEYVENYNDPNKEPIERCFIAVVNKDGKTVWRNVFGSNHMAKCTGR